MAAKWRDQMASWLTRAPPTETSVEVAHMPPRLDLGPHGEGEERFKREQGGWGATEEPYVDLYEHNLWLREQTRWDWSAPFIGGGSLALGGGIGAIAADIDPTSTGVLLCLVAGVVLLICGLALKAERSKGVRAGYESFDRRLCLYEHEPKVKAIRAQLDARAKAQSAEHTLVAKIRRLREEIVG